MASTSSLHNIFASASLCLSSEQTEDQYYALFNASDLPVTYCHTEEPAVIESCNYRMALLTTSPVNINEITIQVNGSEPISVEVSEWEKVGCEEGGNRTLYQALLEQTERTTLRPLFMLTYGFARVHISIICDEEEFSLSTRDIVSLGRESYQDDLVDQMLNDLLNPTPNEIIEWMMTGKSGGPKRYTSIQATPRHGSPTSLSGYLQLIEKIVTGFRKHRNYFRCHGYTVISHATEKLPSQKVRHLGRRELLWISKNAGTLRKTPSDTAIRYRGECYLPQHLETLKNVKVFDSYENRVLLGFLHKVIGSAKRVRAELRNLADTSAQEIDRISLLIKSNHYDESRNCASMRLIGACNNRESKLLARLDGLLCELEKERRIYSQIFSGVKPQRCLTPRRTKVFQEVEAYSVLYELMKSWLVLGDYTLGADAFIQQIYRLDELYEYYVLYRILSYLYEEGFREDEMVENPIEHVTYSTGYGKSSNNFHIANKYFLCKDGIRIRLYYEPCIRGDDVEEHGITLHRLSNHSSFSRKKRRRDSCWTPDYLIEVTDKEGRRTFHIMDAKFRSPSDVYSGFPFGNECEFSSCLFKYKFDIAGKEADEFISSIWLFCGRSNISYCRSMEQSSWALEHYKGFRSGIGVLTPYQSCLNEVFQEILPTESISSQASLPSVNVKSEVGSNHLRRIESQPNNSAHTHADNYIVDLYRAYHNKQSLFLAEWSQKNVGISHPLLRKGKPQGREGKKYRSINADGQILYFFADLLPLHITKIAKLISRCRSIDHHASKSTS